MALVNGIRSRQVGIEFTARIRGAVGGRLWLALGSKVYSLC